MSWVAYKRRPLTFKCAQIKNAKIRASDVFWASNCLRSGIEPHRALLAALDVSLGESGSPPAQSEAAGMRCYSGFCSLCFSCFTLPKTSQQKPSPGTLSDLLHLRSEHSGSFQRFKVSGTPLSKKTVLPSNLPTFTKSFLQTPTELCEGTRWA